MLRKLLISSLLVVSAAWAQTQIATVTSTAPFTLRGATVTPGNGVPTWPVLDGDSIKSGVAITIVKFPDGSLMVMDPGAEAKVSFANGKPVFQLLAGKADYSLTSMASLQILEVDQPYTPTSVTGSFDPPQQGGDPQQQPGAAGGAAPGAGGAAPAGTGSVGATNLGGKKTLILALLGAAAVGLAVGITEATSGGPAVTPSQ